MLVLFSTVLMAQQDTDALFATARGLPKSRRAEAQELCLQALERSPGYADVRIYLARLYAWDGRYPEARLQLRQVLTAEPGNQEAWDVAIDVESWADQPREALRLCQEGLVQAPGSAQLHYRKARLLKADGRLEAAMQSVQTAMVLDPDHPEARQLREDLKDLLRRDKVSLSVSHDEFTRTFSPWTTLAASYSHHFDAGTAILRVTQARMFDTWGTQVEVDAYPHLADGTYAYLNVGKSYDSIFPDYRYGAEVYHNFRGGVEASLGLRYMNFGASSSVTIYTGSVGKYVGNWLYTLRMNHTPSIVGAAESGSLTARRYLGDDADTYLTAMVGMGASPDQPNWSDYVMLLHSRQASLSGQKALGRAWIASAGLEVERDEYFTNSYRIDTTYSVGLAKRF